MDSPRHSSFRTDDLQEAREFLDLAYGAKLRVEAPVDADLPFVSRQVATDGAAVAEVQVPFKLEFELVGQGDYLFTTVFEGSIEHHREGGTERFGRGDTFLAMVPQGEEPGRADRIRVRTVTLPTELLDATAGRDPAAGSQSWRFLSLRPVPGGERCWENATRLLDSVLADPGTCQEPLVLGPATRLLAAVALTAFPNDAPVAARPRESRDAHPDALRRAIAFIEENPARDITVDDVARAAQVSPRAIHIAFGRHLGATPTAYLRKVRLAEAHRRLEEADPGDGTTVTGVANEWGFADPSRFASHYRAAYGRPPSKTLAG